MATSSSTTSAIPQWQAVGQAKREAVSALLPREWRADPIPAPEELRDATRYAEQFLTAEEKEITGTLSAAALLDRIAKGQLTAVQVTKAFCHRATIAHQLVSTASLLAPFSSTSPASMLLWLVQVPSFHVQRHTNIPNPNTITDKNLSLDQLSFRSRFQPGHS